MKNEQFGVISPVVDLRKEPFPSKNYYEKDPLQESQLIYGEILAVIKEENGWVFVEAMEQQKRMSSGEWKGYPGWVQRNQIAELESIPAYNLIVLEPWAAIEIPGRGHIYASMGTKLAGIEELPEEWVVKLHDNQTGKISKKYVNGIQTNNISRLKRNHMIALGQKLLGAPYHWGGRSVYNPAMHPPLTSLDCSGFTNLLYRTQGMDIPRDAHDQYLQSKAIEYSEMQPGDLVFLAYALRPERMDHVMLFTGHDGFFESTMSHKKIRAVTGMEKLGKPLWEIANGQTVGEYQIHFGRTIFIETETETEIR